jgi:hypothetical protein
MRLFRISTAALMILGLFSLAYAIHETIPAETQITLPGPDAPKLYEYITVSKPYTRWEMWPGKGKMYKGTQPHGDFLTTYVNDAGLTAIRKMQGAMPDGSIIAKENYGPDRKFTGLSVMYKIKGFNPAASDWFWAKYNADGKALASGRVEGCIKCHDKMKDNDRVFTGILKK